MCCRPEVLPPPVWTPPEGTTNTCEAVGEAAPTSVPGSVGVPVDVPVPSGVPDDVVPVGVPSVPGAVGVAEVGAAGGVVVGAAVGAEIGAPTTLLSLLRLTVQVRNDPPPVAVPLHWLTLTGSAAVTVELVAMEQLIPPPPPVTEPLHWVTGAPLVLAMVQRSAVPAPLEPTH